MTYLQYPRNLPGLVYAKIRRPKHSVSVQTHQSGGEVRMSYWSEPLWEWDLTYELLRDSARNGHPYNELQQIEGLFLTSAGSLAGFQFWDEDDNCTFQSGLGSTVSGQTSYTLFRWRGTAAAAGSESIGFLDTTQPFNLYVDGTPIDISDPVFGYTLNTGVPKYQRLVFNSAPPAGRALSCDMSRGVNGARRRVPAGRNRYAAARGAFPRSKRVRNGLSAVSCGRFEL